MNRPCSVRDWFPPSIQREAQVQDFESALRGLYLVLCFAFQSKALRERWLLEGAPSSTAEEGEAMKKQMQEDDLKAKELEESVQR